MEELTVKELQEKLVEMGMPEDDVKAFRTKAPLIATIRTLEAKEVVEETKSEVEPAGDVEEEKVKKVKTLEESPDPKEDRKVDKRWKNKAEKMKIHLLAQEQVSILIPLEANETAGVVEWRTNRAGENYQVQVEGDIETVQLNGYKYFIPKGRYTKVPMQIAEVISKSQQQTLDAGRDVSMDRTDPRTGRPMSEVL